MSVFSRGRGRHRLPSKGRRRRSDPPRGQGPVVRVRGLTFRYRREKVLHDVGLEVHAGDFCALIGPNGSGKSTLCDLLQGTVKPPPGTEMTVCGRPVGTLEACQSISYCGGNDHMPQFLTGAEFLRYAARLHGAPGKVTAARTSEIFARLGMAGRQEDIMETYSHGMLKKTQVASALLLSPGLIIVDETLNGVDIEAQLWIESELRRFCGRGGAVLMCSHDFSMLSRCASRVVMLDRGRVVESSSVSGLRRRGVGIEDLVLNYLGNYLGVPGAGGHE